MAEPHPTSPAAARRGELAADGSTRSRVILAGLELVEEVSSDSLTVAMLVERSGVARATIYNHFGSVTGVVATAWAEVGAPWLEHAMAVGADPSLDQPMVDILVAARREPELREVVVPDLRLAWEQASASGEVAALRAAWLLMGVVGSVLSEATFPDVARFDAIAALVAGMEDDIDVGERPALPQGFLSEPLRSTWFAEEDPIRRRLLEADELVVAGAGLKAASMLRICRSARLTTGATSPRFDSLIDLHLEAFRSAITGVVEDNADRVSTILPSISPEDTFALHIPMALHPSRELWRSHRQEILYATRVNAELAAGVQSSFDEANEAFAKAMLGFGVSEELVDIGVVVNQVISSGGPAIHALGIPVDALDHRIVLRHLVAGVASS